MNAPSVGGSTPAPALWVLAILGGQYAANCQSCHGLPYARSQAAEIPQLADQLIGEDGKALSDTTRQTPFDLYSFQACPMQTQAG